MNVFTEDHNFKMDPLVMGIILILVGILLIIFKKDSFGQALKLVGMFLSIYGILMIYNGITSNLNISIVIGTTYSVLGFTFIVFSNLLTGIFMVLIALILIVGIIQILDHILKAITSNKSALYYIVIAIVISTIVLYILLNIDMVTDAIMVIIGVILIIIGSINICNATR